MPLKEYAEKRNFRKTREPPVRKKNAARESLMFVVQEHHASHLHYDFRLEWRGVLKSWAVPKGPSLDPHLKRLAVEVEDHPLEYGQFEGEIPEGEYGAGRVLIWDTGIWIPQGSVQQGLRKGHLEFELRGAKLKGGWDLIRTRGPGKKPQWLLIKKSDRYAKQGHEVSRGRRSRKAFPFVEPMLARAVDAPPKGKDWIHEVKMDGYRIQAHLENGRVRLFTRNGHDWTARFGRLARSLAGCAVQSAVLDGEVVAWDGRLSHFQHLQNSLSEGDDLPLHYCVFDLLMLNGEDLRDRPLSERRRRLEPLFKKTPDIFFSEELKSVTAKSLEALAVRGIEGVVSKRRDSEYVSGRKELWVKSKFIHREEFVIGGYTQGRHRGESLGALLLGKYDGPVLHYVGKVGTGFDENTLEELLRKLKRLSRVRSPFLKEETPREKNEWVQPRLVAEVRFSDWTADGHLRAPVFVSLREDKLPEQVQQEELLLTHPEKELYPGEGVTKLDVARYYMAVAPRLQKYLYRRNLALLRCPEGVTEECFFQKHISGGQRPRYIQQSAGFLFVEDVRGLLELVQMGGFEIHAGNATSDDPDRPDQLVLDLDPGVGVPWKTVVRAALEIHSELAKLGLRSYIKLSGGKGVHIHVPFRKGPGWDEVGAFAQSFVMALEMKWPGTYVSRSGEKNRKERIFVDYLRNSEKATSVIPYSLRARPGASVAWPISWQQFKKTASGSAIDIHRALKLLNKSPDPWKDFFQRLPVLSLARFS